MSRTKPLKEGKQTKAPEDCMTFVVHTGEIGSTVQDLELDIRTILAPYTFDKLRVTPKNKIRDFTEAAGDLQAKMMILLRSQTDKLLLSINRFPRGPTLHFNVKRFTLIKDVRQGSDKAAIFHKTHPGTSFPILEGFGDSNEDQTMVGIFQGLFPTLDLNTSDLSNMKRAVLFSKGPDGLISIRHYAIEKRDPNKSVALSKIDSGKLADLGQYNSIEEYVEKTQKSAPKKKNLMTISLKEIGPRIDMKLDLVELNLFGGIKLQETIDKRKKKFAEKQKELKEKAE